MKVGITSNFTHIILYCILKVIGVASAPLPSTTLTVNVTTPSDFRVLSLLPLESVQHMSIEINILMLRQDRIWLFGIENIISEATLILMVRRGMVGSRVTLDPVTSMR